MTRTDRSAGETTPDISLVAFAIGPERIVARTLETAVQQAAERAELVIVHDWPDDAEARRRMDPALGGRHAIFVGVGASSPGAALNAGVRRGTGPCFVVIDGSEEFGADHVSTALQAFEAQPDAPFAAAPGGPLFGSDTVHQGAPPRVDSGALVGSPWSTGAPVVRRRAFEEAGGFDESLPTLVGWDLLLTLTDTGAAGVLLPLTASRAGGDDVRLRESLRAERYLPAVRHIVAKHQATFDRLMKEALVQRERTAAALWRQERTLLDRRDRVRADLAATLARLDEIRPILAQHQRRTLEFADLRRTTPVSRNWGSERGQPVDRHYIRSFLEEHAADVRGHVLEMLDANLTTTYGADSVSRADVLDIDPGNERATIVADLRIAEQLPENTYDCFILTQTLHLIDDMPAALRAAHRALKPGGVLLASLPCASMVAVEYGPGGDHWRVTEAGARALLERVFDPSRLSIRAHGNVLTIAAFLYGLSCDDLDAEEFEVDDPAYPLVITVRAEKAPPAVSTRGLSARGMEAVVLLYHRVATAERDLHALAISPDAFRSQLDALCSSWHIVRLSELAAAASKGEPPERTIALTFDDGYLDNLEIAAPILHEYGVPATFFLTSERRPGSGVFWWDALEWMLLAGDDIPDALELRIAGASRTVSVADADARRAAHDELYAIFKGSTPAVRDDLLTQISRSIRMPAGLDAQRPMTVGEIQRLRSFPLIDVGAHSVHHLSLPLLSPEDCHSEVFESRSALERLIGQPVSGFAYPFGDVSPGAVRAVMEAGFDYAVGCETRVLRAREHPLKLPRLATGEESGAELAARLVATT